MLRAEFNHLMTRLAEIEESLDRDDESECNSELADELNEIVLRLRQSVHEYKSQDLVQLY